MSKIILPTFGSSLEVRKNKNLISTSPMAMKARWGWGGEKKSIICSTICTWGFCQLTQFQHEDADCTRIMFSSSSSFCLWKEIRCLLFHFLQEEAAFWLARTEWGLLSTFHIDWASPRPRPTAWRRVERRFCCETISVGFSGYPDSHIAPLSLDAAARTVELSFFVGGGDLNLNLDKNLISTFTLSQNQFGWRLGGGKICLRHFEQPANYLF